MYYEGIYDDHTRAMREVTALRRDVQKLLSIYGEPDSPKRKRAAFRIDVLMSQIDYWKREAESLERWML